MLSDLVLSKQVRLALSNFVSSGGHALVITGPKGMGKGSVAEGLAMEILHLGVQGLTSYAYYKKVQPENGSISIEAIRQLQQFVKLRTTGADGVRRVIVIEQADSMTQEAQNALLKLLEEPPADTAIILTSDVPRQLLPTILSRLQRIAMTALPAELLSAVVSQSLAPDDVKKRLLTISGGLPGLLSALVTDEKEHPLIAGIDLAKDILRRDTFGRLALVDTLSKQKEQVANMLLAFERVAAAGLHAAAEKNDIAGIRRWQNIRHQSLQAGQALASNASTKLVLDSLFMAI